MNGREADEAQIMLDAVPNIDQYIFCSSAGVYLKSDQMPHREEDAVDPKSRAQGAPACACRHGIPSWLLKCSSKTDNLLPPGQGKLNTEDLLTSPVSTGRPFGQFTFTDRSTTTQSKNGSSSALRRADQSLCQTLEYRCLLSIIAAANHVMLMSRLMVLTGVLVSDVQVTQLGHVKDLATAFVKVLSHPKASRRCSTSRRAVRALSESGGSSLSTCSPSEHCGTRF